MLPNIGVYQNGWFIMENPMIWGYPSFGNIHIIIYSISKYTWCSKGCYLNHFEQQGMLQKSTFHHPFSSPLSYTGCITLSPLHHAKDSLQHTWKKNLEVSEITCRCPRIYDIYDTWQWCYTIWLITSILIWFLIYIANYMILYVEKMEQFLSKTHQYHPVSWRFTTNFPTKIHLFLAASKNNFAAAVVVRRVSTSRILWGVWLSWKFLSIHHQRFLIKKDLDAIPKPPGVQETNNKLDILNTHIQQTKKMVLRRKTINTSNKNRVFAAIVLFQTSNVSELATVVSLQCASAGFGWLLSLVFCFPRPNVVYEVTENILVTPTILLMAEILHHLGCMKPYK